MHWAGSSDQSQWDQNHDCDHNQDSQYEDSQFSQFDTYSVNDQYSFCSNLSSQLCLPFLSSSFLLGQFSSQPNQISYQVTFSNCQAQLNTSNSQQSAVQS